MSIITSKQANLIYKLETELGLSNRQCYTQLEAKNYIVSLKQYKRELQNIQNQQSILDEIKPLLDKD